MRGRFGEHDWAKQALLACRLVERGSSFVTINLRNHSASTIYHHMGVSLDATYTDHQGRPNFIVDQGTPLRELI